MGAQSLCLASILIRSPKRATEPQHLHEVPLVPRLVLSCGQHQLAALLHLFSIRPRVEVFRHDARVSGQAGGLSRSFAGRWAVALTARILLPSDHFISRLSHPGQLHAIWTLRLPQTESVDLEENS